MNRAERKRVAGELRRWAEDPRYLLSQLALNAYWDAETATDGAIGVRDQIDLNVLSVAEAVEQGCWP